MELNSVERQWSKELDEDVEIVPRGWAHSPTDYALYIGGTHMISYRKVEEIEDYLARYFMVRGN